MKQLPHTISAYKRTPEFTETTVPKGLLKDHQTKDGVWGKIVVIEGSLQYTIIEPILKTVTLTKEQYGVVEPKVLHHIKPLGPVRFYVEFSR